MRREKYFKIFSILFFLDSIAFLSLANISYSSLLFPKVPFLAKKSFPLKEGILFLPPQKLLEKSYSLLPYSYLLPQDPIYFPYFLLLPPQDYQIRPFFLKEKSLLIQYIWQYQNSLILHLSPIWKEIPTEDQKLFQEALEKTLRKNYSFIQKIWYYIP